MKVFTTLVTILLSLNSILAMPTTGTGTETLEKRAIPRCKNQGLTDFCLARNANAYCDRTGFHNNFMAQCAANCWCE
ncbi:hypothetical protein QBC38DRAFT_456083 [Podospora fimiseda]|uniref:Uncharacterized protein n=1 Tax=Podospora fimiseda TaxID=252190 RepID=A0AAN7GXA5_9PEZI|nr:hypothetical protein QBC38DRAFT_456083 [Podospora fimiseda]